MVLRYFAPSALPHHVCERTENAKKCANYSGDKKSFAGHDAAEAPCRSQQGGVLAGSQVRYKSPCRAMRTVACGVFAWIASQLNDAKDAPRARAGDGDDACCPGVAGR